MTRKIGSAIVVGAGIAGIRAALDLAETGYGVTLIDRSPHLGGILSQLDYQFPTDRCGMCKMLPLTDRDASSQYCLRKGLFHENIEILLSTEIVSVEGDPGHFQVRLKQKPTWVDPAMCVGCGLCSDVCPVEVPDEFNAGLTKRKAIWLPVPHAIPNPYSIDFAACNRCGECVKVCPTGAICLAEKERQKFRILVVDDELVVRDSLKEWLEEEGFYVDMAESGRDALSLLAKGPYHLMLTDIKMPGMDGVELLQRAKDAFPDLTVIMMTAYASVETAVEAMKIGALDYLIKPFDPEKMIPMVVRVCEEFQIAEGRQVEAGAIVFCVGADYFNPADGKNTYGYGIIPNVVTSIEFERILSGSGPGDGKLIRPSDGKPIRKVLWIQCVGSRNLQTDADFCSNICCMHAIKEALVAKEKTGGELEATILYMDMRTFGKSYQRYRDRAERDRGVRFQRGRVHSVVAADGDGNLRIRYADHAGTIHEETHDMIVLSVGQRPASGTADVAEMLGIARNAWGFCQTEPFSTNAKNVSFMIDHTPGIFVGGSCSGPRDISESVVQSSAAALSASRVIHTAGGGLAPKPTATTDIIDVSREFLRILVVVCTCGGAILDSNSITARFKSDPFVKHVEIMDRICTAEGWDELVTRVEKQRPNRILIGTCLPHVYARKLGELGQTIGLPSSLIDVVDIRTPTLGGVRKSFFADGVRDLPNETDRDAICGDVLRSLGMGIAKLRQINPYPVETVEIRQNALVVGGGIAGLTAALAIADHGFHVDLVEKAQRLGGNLIWLKRTIDGWDTRTFLDETVKKIENQPLITVRTQTEVIASYGEIGNFHTTLQGEGPGTKRNIALSLEHGVTILATGGVEAEAAGYGYGQSDKIVTQKEFAVRCDENTLDPTKLESVVMIQCAGSREEPRNYCSRVCCASALKNALCLKEKNPDINVFVLYRDMMAYGFMESYYTQTRKAGVVFIQYDPGNKPRVEVTGGLVHVTVDEPILGRPVIIETDLLVLATGIVPTLPESLVRMFGADLDQDGFFREAEYKWRPVDSLKDGIFACGLTHSPRSVAESVATAEAAAQRALRILVRKHLPAGKVVAIVRHALCSLCQRCIDACPYGARALDMEGERVEVNPVMCQGCGSCATVCPNGASVLEGFHKRQMLEAIDAALA